MATWYPHNPSAGQRIQGVAGTTPCDEAFIAHESIKAVLGSTKTVHATLTCGEAVVTTTAAITQPDVPRNLVMTGNAGANEVITANGLNAAGAAITEDFTLSGTTPIVGAKAFKTVTSIVTPIGTHTVAIVCGNVLGLINKLAADTFLLKKFDNATDAGTVAVSATALESNTYALAGTLNGTKLVDLYYIV
jgi:hypothetical protein